MILIRILTLPFLPIFATIIWLRNFSYDKGIINSNAFDIPVIGVGNLSVGGTGKTPFTEYLIRLLKSEFKIGVISRGYLRKTKGYLEVHVNMSSRETGDEPLQMKKKFNTEIKLAVERQRILGITSLLTDHPETDVILLDDAYQHRSVKPGINILLTTWDEPFCNDMLMPLGDLREFRRGRKRADIVIVTKCPPELEDSKRTDFEHKLKLNQNQLLAFSTVKYNNFKEVFTHKEVKPSERIILLTGIAEPKPLLAELKSRNFDIKHLAFNDHHHFSEKDIQKLKELFDNFDASWVVTTEKDAVRLLSLKKLIEEKQLSVCYLEIESDIVYGKKELEERIVSYVRENKDNHRVPEN